MNTFMGFGDVAVQAATTAQPTFWDKANAIITKVVQPAANVYSQVVNKPAAPGGAYQPIQTAYPTPTSSTQGAQDPGAPKTDNTKKYLVIGGVIVLVGTGIYFATRKTSTKK